MKRSWLIPRFSLSNLLMLMVIIGLCLAWYVQRRKLGEQAAVIEKQRLEIAQLTVTNILRSDMPDAHKLRALEPYVHLGDSIREVVRRLGVPETVGGPLDGSGRVHFIYDCGLFLNTCEERVISIEYTRNKTQGGNDAVLARTEEHNCQP